MKRVLLVVTAAAALLGGGWVVNDRASFDRASWLADFEQLKSATEQSYANLRWSRISTHTDLVALNANALQGLRQATSNPAARRAIAEFISGFNDRHFRIENAPPKPVVAMLKLFERDGTVALAKLPRR